MSDEKKNTKKSGSRRKTIFWLVAGAVLLTAVLTVCSVGVRAFRRSQIVLDGGAPHLNATERLYLQTYLVARNDDLYRTAGDYQDVVPFTVEPGEGAGQIAQRLGKEGVLADPDLFLRYVQYYGYDNQLEAGSYRINPYITIPQLAVTLTEAQPEEIIVTFIEGWRMEEMAAVLRRANASAIDADRFLAIARRETPFDTGRYTFNIPDGATMEGYLFPDTYRLDLDATADDLVHLMLSTFDERVTPQMRQAYGMNGLELYEAVTLASIIQREAVHDDEKPVMAGVFYNRLDENIPLQADPTVQYAVGYQADTNSWWKSPLWQTDLDFDSPYNTYVYDGLPPGPIAGPGLAALQAVAYPDSNDYIFFVVDCTAARPNTHAFNVEYSDHLNVVENCR